MSLTEQEVIELAKSVQSDESDKKQELVMMYPNEVIAFANALHAKFVESLVPVGEIRNVYPATRMKPDMKYYDKDYVGKVGIKFYALPDEVK